MFNDRNISLLVFRISRLRALLVRYLRYVIKYVIVQPMIPGQSLDEG